MLPRTAAWARAMASELLDQSSDRWAHVVGVAGAAVEAAMLVAPDDRELLVAAAWAHDIGYASEAADTGLHQLDGARWLRRHSADERLCRLVAHHTFAVVEADVRGLADTLLAEFPAEGSSVAGVLTFADMTTGPDGRRLTVDERLSEILGRYPDSHAVHRAIAAAADDIVSTVAAVESRLAAARGSQPR